jgi:hypothetical protein
MAFILFGRFRVKFRLNRFWLFGKLS